jgi:hypothetical protein
MAPKRLLYPTELVDRRVFRLQRELRLLLRRFRRGEISKLQLDADGQYAIQRSFKVAESDIRVWLEKRGLKFEGDRSELTVALEEALKRWQMVVADV